ncbi:hypothetical protein PR202_ga28957 [Eleusine coracana subsp. coracana]|uniref:Uncharacterized protein n=1 Tax=Eleusine coracana subsp. coracana TaxID=191504 RepID=A0AAV5DL51_ELECO|nr:hypothetical protein PR202_ga28957 [Eleusine coracana subsp. coracana]
MASADAAKKTSSIVLKTLAAICVVLLLSSSLWQPALAVEVDPNCKKCVDGCMIVADASCSGVGCTVPVVNQTCRDQEYQLCGSSCFKLCTIIPSSLP